ncbi:RagB/SusD family nutrient uptake outer membrane protein [Chitinophaga sp. 22321]|uniref:RagB/SusD family nutrient uptake outer membrane protein n=1 Tax=Chitinophaga hostae TaxID=2831022 RepID=A0ABS5IX83_9BACT|nr:RagB/SusD family nutrient uptake outer membrane protein [Chitinophaga hostae]MBS0027564.1 RagB/SusD family nutrient uptake outer membrane protein [Chitinophaga hostae]
MHPIFNNKSQTTQLFRVIFPAVLFLITQLPTSCKKFVDVKGPTTNITGDNVFSNDGTAAALLTGIYTKISSNSLASGDLASIAFLTGLSGDELSLYSGYSNPDLKNYYSNSLIATQQPSIWNNIYPKLFIVNSIIEKVPSSQSLSPGVKTQLLGEAKFMRAFFLFYLVNLYGNVPLVTSTDYKINSSLPRADKSDVWQQIISDLKDAKELLTQNYVDATLLNSTTERVRPNKWAAIALLARSYLFIGDWNNAEKQSTEILNNTALFHLDSLTNTFQKNSSESIWQLQPVNYGSNTEDAKTYILHSTGFTFSKPVYLSTELVNSFENSDQRKARWTDSIDLNGKIHYFASKYKSDSLNAPVTEYNTVLRLSEQFLIRSEARAHQNNIQGSLNDLNAIRKRAWLANVQLNNMNSILNAISHERKVELFTEWGHRWLDLKRTEIVNNVMSTVTPQKGGTWSPNWQLYPIPPSDILADANIIQNKGY